MSAPDPLALYKAVMGDAWGEDYQKAKARKADAVERTDRSYKRAGKPSVRNLAKKASGSRSAVFKRIRKGGCKTRKSLRTQLSYVNDKAALTFTNAMIRLGETGQLSEGQKDSICDSWQDTWRGSSKLGFTSHMLLSFPPDVSVDQVRDIAMDWCEHFFESGHYEDTWDYFVAIHDDRENNHAHIILNNRGNDFGTWFSCWRDGIVSPQLMREVQADIAEKYGVVLDATTRLERGLLDRPPTLEEVYAAQAEGRLARQRALTEEEMADAQSVVLGFATEYRNVADLLETAQYPELAKSVEAMAIALENGEQLAFGEGDIDMQTLKDIKTIGEAVEFAQAHVADVQSGIEAKDGAERIPAELAAEDDLHRLSPFIIDPEMRHDYNRTLERVYPPGADAGVLSDLEMLMSDRVNDEFKEVLDYAREIGLDVEEQLIRYVEGGSANLGTVNAWIERDVLSIARNLAGDAELDISGVTADQHHEACDKLDTFQMKLAKQMGLEIQSAFLSRDEFDGTDQSLEVERVDPETELSHAEKSLQWLADVLRSQERKLTEDQEEALTDWLFDAVHMALGEEGRARLERGDYKVLEGIIENPVDQIDVTRQYLEVSAEERGAPELSGVANELLGERADLAGAQANAKARQRALEKGFDLSDDDDMGL